MRVAPVLDERLRNRNEIEIDLSAKAAKQLVLAPSAAARGRIRKMTGQKEDAKRGPRVRTSHLSMLGRSVFRPSMRTARIRSHRNELVTDATYRHHPFRVRSVAFDLVPEVRDVDVAGALVPDVRRVPQVLHDLAAAEDTLRLLREQHEELELGRGEPLVVAVDRNLVANRIELESADTQHRRRARAIELASPDDRADAHDQLGHRERLRDVVVGPDLEAEDAVQLGALRREHDDRHRALSAEPPAHLGA